MSVELLNSSRFFGFRVRRQIDNETYQEYFSLKRGGRPMRGAARAEVRRQAEVRDAQLAITQRAARERALREVRLDADGRVRGILFRWKKERSGKRSPIFQVGITSLLNGNVVNTTVSVNRHGLDEAWRRAVDFYARHRRIRKGSNAYRALLRARPPPTVLQPASAQPAAITRGSGIALERHAPLPVPSASPVARIGSASTESSHGNRSSGHAKAPGRAPRQG